MLDLAHYKSLLIDLRQELTKRVKAIEKDLHHVEEKVEQDFAEQATQRENDDVLNSLDNDAKDKLIAIDKALLRIETGDYGYCEECGEAIDEKRLKAIPFAIRCIDCAD